MRLVGDFLRVRQVVDHAVQQVLHALVLVGGAAEHRGKLELEGAGPDPAADILDGGLLVLEEDLGELVVVVGGGRDQIVAHRLRLIEQLGGDLLGEDLLAVLAVVVVRLHGDEVHHALELVLGADGELHQDRVVVQLLAQLLVHAEGVRAGAVHLVDEGEAGDLVALHLAVDGDRLALHAGDGVEHQDGAVEHPQRALHLDGEVDVSGGVDDVDVVHRAGAVGGVPLAVRGRGLDGDALLALQIHRVHLRADGILALHLVDLVDPARVIEDALGQRRLARIDVGRDPDVADEVDVRLRHVCLPECPGKGALQLPRNCAKNQASGGSFARRPACRPGCSRTPLGCPRTTFVARKQPGGLGKSRPS